MSVPKATLFEVTVAVSVTFDAPSHATEPSKSPAKVSVRAVCHLEEVAALPISSAVTLQAEKLPSASLTTTLSGRFEKVASTCKAGSEPSPPLPVTRTQFEATTPAT